MLKTCSNDIYMKFDYIFVKNLQIKKYYEGY